MHNDSIRRLAAVPLSAANAAGLSAAHAAGLAAALAVFLATVNVAMATPEQTCEAGKNAAAGKYAACIAKAEKGLVASGDMVKYDAAILKCATTQAGAWTKLEDAAGGSCPSSGDQVAIADFLDAGVASVAAAVAGYPLLPDVVTCNSDLDTCTPALAGCSSDLSICEVDLPSCSGDLAVCLAQLVTRIQKTGQTTCYNNAGSVISCAGSGQDGQFQAGDAQTFVDNGNGTITDQVTGLMWEKLSDDGSIHDKDNTYAGISGGVGKASSLNGAVFAGHSDWRLPNRRELASITDLGRNSPAVNPVFHTNCVGGVTVLTGSCTKSSVYASSSTYLLYPLASWKLNFDDGDIYAGDRTDMHYVRLVRTAG